MTALLASHAVDRGRFKPPAVVFAALDLNLFTKAIGLQDSPRGTRYLILDHRGQLVARVPTACARHAAGLWSGRSWRASCVSVRERRR